MRFNSQISEESFKKTIDNPPRTFGAALTPSAELGWPVLMMMMMKLDHYGISAHFGIFVYEYYGYC